MSANMNYINNIFAYNLVLIILLFHVLCDDEMHESGAKVSTPLKRIRDNVVKYCHENNDKCHENDVQRIKIKDWFINDYVKEYKGDEIKAEKAILKDIEDFKNANSRELTENYFPSEFWSTGLFSLVTKSDQNEIILGVIGPCYVPSESKQINELMLQWIRWTLLRFIKMSEPNKNSIVYLSVAGMQLKNIDLGLFKTLLLHIKGYLNRFEGNVIIFDMNLIVKKLLSKISSALLSQKVNNNIKLEKMKDEKYITLKDIPVSVGGNNAQTDRIPKGVQSAKCLPHLQNIPHSDWDQFYTANKKCIDEGKGDQQLNDYLQYCE